MTKPFSEQAEDAGLNVKAPEELEAEPPKDTYAAAVITFLDRSTGEKKAMCYPVTSVELFGMTAEELAAGQMPRAVRRFVVEKQGEWVEKEVGN